MKRYAIYARYSTDLQSEKSTEDQIFECQKLIRNNGGIVVGIYQDQALSGGTSLTRPDYQRLLKDAAAKKFDIILAEGLERLSRDQEDTAYLYKHMKFHGVTIFTLADGEINELHIGLKGTMNALYLKDVSLKTRRGLEGRIRAGKNPGSRAYGYDLVRELDESGELIRGDLKIDPFEAQIVQRIFEEFADGKSPLQIAKGLNAEKIPGPRGGLWRDSAIRGDPKVGSGILNHRLYIGERVWNRKNYIKNPATGKKVYRITPESEWNVTKVPALAIISDNLWKSVKARQQEVSDKAMSMRGKNKLTNCRRTNYLLSGLLYCGECGSRYSLGSADRYNCSNYKNRHGCTNGRSIVRQNIESKVLSVLTEKLLNPELVGQFIDDYLLHRAAAEKRDETEQAACKSEIAGITKRIDGILNAIEKGVVTDSTLLRLQELERRKAELQLCLKKDEPLPVLNKALIEEYRSKIADLANALDDEKIRYAAMNVVRPLIDKIVLIPNGQELMGEFHGSLAGLVSERIENGDTFFASASQISVPLGSVAHRYQTRINGESSILS